jgi:hypothetical protein
MAFSMPYPAREIRASILEFTSIMNALGCRLVPEKLDSGQRA